MERLPAISTRTSDKEKAINFALEYLKSGKLKSRGKFSFKHYRYVPGDSETVGTLELEYKGAVHVEGESG